MSSKTNMDHKTCCQTPNNSKAGQLAGQGPQRLESTLPLCQVQLPATENLQYIGGGLS